MERPIPNSNKEKFDIISLLFILNYIPNAIIRGEMLRQTCKFLQLEKQSKEAKKNLIILTLFLVLPTLCVINSYYLTKKYLILIIDTLGFVLIYKKLSAKLVYYL